MTLAKRWVRICLPHDYLSSSLLLAHVSLCVPTPPICLLIHCRTRLFAAYHSLLVLLLTSLIAGVFYLMLIQTKAHLPVFSVLLIMRVYALYFRNRWILGIVVFEFIGGISLACVSTAVDDQNCLHINFCSGPSLDCCPY